MTAFRTHFCLLLFALSIEAVADATESEKHKGFLALERFALVELLTPQDPDGLVVQSLKPTEIRRPEELEKAWPTDTPPGQEPQNLIWLSVVANYTVWGNFPRALQALELAEPEPEEQHDARVIEAWLKERNGKVAEARLLYRTLALKVESRADMLRLLICLELRHRLYNRAKLLSDELKEFEESQDEEIPSSSLLLHGLVSFAIRDDLSAYTTWVELSNRPPSQQIAEGYLGMACLSFDQQGADSSLGWMVKGLAVAAPETRRQWFDSRLGVVLASHPLFDTRTAIYRPAPETDPVKMREGSPLYQAYMEEYEALQRPDTHLRMQIYKEETEYRTISLLDPRRDLPEQTPLPDTAPEKEVEEPE